MTKITIGVYKSFRNSGIRNHRKKTKKHWCHYFLDVDDDESGDYQFGSEWVSSFKALILKRQVYKKRKFICPECGLIFEGLVRKDSDSVECPECET